MNWSIEVLLISGGVLGLTGALIMLINIASAAWMARQFDEIENLHPFDCEKFHEIQNKPRPWYVKLNNWLESHYV